MNKKHTSGFAPIPFRTAGRIIIPLSLAAVMLDGLDYLLKWDLIPQSVFFIGLGFLVLGLYLRYVVPIE